MEIVKALVGTLNKDKALYWAYLKYSSPRNFVDTFTTHVAHTQLGDIIVIMPQSNVHAQASTSTTS